MLFKKEDVITLLQGQWCMVHPFRHSFVVAGNEIMNVEGFGGVAKTTYSLSWNGHLFSWVITVPEFGWNNMAILNLDENTFHLFEVTVITVDNTDIEYRRN